MSSTGNRGCEKTGGGPSRRQFVTLAKAGVSSSPRQFSSFLNPVTNSLYRHLPSRIRGQAARENQGEVWLRNQPSQGDGRLNINPPSKRQLCKYHTAPGRKGSPSRLFLDKIHRFFLLSQPKLRSQDLPAFSSTRYVHLSFQFILAFSPPFSDSPIPFYPVCMMRTQRLFMNLPLAKLFKQTHIYVVFLILA